MAGARAARKRAAGEDAVKSTTVALKRARLVESPEQDGGDLGAVTADQHASDATDNEDAGASTPSSPRSMTYTEHSIAETSMTSASGLKKPKKFLCEYEGCGKAFDRPIRLQIHVRSHTNERPFACQEGGCDKTFLRSEHLKAHMKSKHNDDRTYVCDYKMGVNEDGEEIECGKAFHTGTRLRRHVAAHVEKEQTKCQEPGCGQVFRKQETLQRHIKSAHLKEKPFVCTHVDTSDGMTMTCGEGFVSVSQLRAHQSRDHSGVRYFCEICADPPGEELSTIKPSAPQTVGFATYAELQDHTKKMHPPTCATCGHACESNRALKAHMDIVHSSLSDRQRFECAYPGCGRKFTKNGNMRVHMQTVHAKAKTFVCGQFDLSESKKVESWDGQGCGTSFGTKANLEEHIRTQHLGLPGMYRPSKKAKSGASTEAVSVAGGASQTVAMLTGHGYDNDRNIECIEVGCQVRFMREYDFAQHLEVAHGWNVDDINEFLQEREALQGDKFWLGGDDEDDYELRQRLLETLQLDASTGNGLSQSFEEFPDFQMGDGMEHDMMVDPALADH